MKYIKDIESPVGTLTLASDGQSLTGLWIKNQKYYGLGIDEPSESIDLPVFAETKRWLDLYFSGVNPNFYPPLNPKGTEFRQEIWKLLTQIPYGQTVTYGQLSQMMKDNGLKSSPQAVGGAAGHNPISIIIPCHRVLGSDGTLTGYAGGLENKMKFLDLENIRYEK
ncbi:methylated-DNA--[protein]-cysteine S-methyltransferase [Floricoccus penangensis]|uniref:methylated-DNA--[protein]-cysteine S-methyltransferase n=1 Tax=Floricoccus penangensis TaxID=1859475 RepID=UPI00203F1668|nr:methylated-DNA--[protein]-cysteine S-methyltransferase [Floricoccus penangensis]URZ87397.1 methylated-DNA--[protein]-cysteine S-methyltransferase [Floricoccus penangensis]